MGLKIIKFTTETPSQSIYTKNIEILKTKGLIGKELFQSKNDSENSGILYGLSIAPKTKYCIVMDENGVLSQKNHFQRYRRDMVELNFKNFLDLESGETNSSKAKLN